MEDNGFKIIGDTVDRSMRRARFSQAAERGAASSGPDAPPQTRREEDDRGRDPEDDLSERFQKLGLKKLEKVKEQKKVA